MPNDIINTLIAEAYAEGPEGMRRVAEVILNRAAQTGMTPEEVVRQARQFTGYSDPGPAAVRAQRDPQAVNAAQAAWQLAQQPGDPTGGADHYFNPNIVRPSWASAMRPTGEYGDHAFYSYRPVPPNGLPNGAPVPATPSLNVRTLRDPPPLPVRRPPSPSDAVRSAPMSGAAPDWYASMFPAPAAAPVPQQDITAPGNIDRSVEAAASATNPALASALQAYVQPRSAPPMPVGVAQSYVGQDRAPPVLPRSAIGQPPSTRVVQSLPVTLPPPPRPRPNTTGVVAVIPTTTTPAAMPPMPRPRPNTTRVVASIPTVPVRPNQIGQLTPAQTGISASDRVRAAQVPAMQSRLPPSPVAPALDGEFTPEQVARIGMAVGGSPTPPSMAPPLPIPRPNRPPPMPLPASARPVAPATPAVPPRIAPVPFQRPLTGMGGPVLNNPSVAGVAPVPMPRLDRPGLSIGPFRVGGPIGALTTAMANSSGPFNNGADNLLYNVMRGGDFNTPGAATTQAGGYLFAPKDGGGFINVGRSDPSISAAEDYDRRNAPNRRPRNAAQRMRGKSGPGGGARSLTS